MYLKNKKFLYVILVIIVILILTLTVVYAALSTQLTISGNADVVGSAWDVHLENPIVTSGSVSNALPTITDSSKATFNVTLSVPGDFYEFTIDVVNDGSIDAMVDSVVKTPELTEEQAKYFNYDITYQNGESITSKQLVKSGSFVRLNVRLEYRKDLTESDLPTSTVSLSLGCTLIYSQADSNGVEISHNGKKGIEFTLEGTKYVIYDSMTWEEWLSTPDGISSKVYVEKDYLCGDVINNQIVSSKGVVKATDYIYSDDFDASTGYGCK